jgi:beta-phosphoglucomutase-like phosphatase (HAD superfamily)
MNNEFSFEITNESKNAINEILKQQGVRHFKLYTDFYGELDVINYEEYQKLEEEKDKEIERLRKREKKWEKWTTEKEILSTKMSEYLCKWKNIKREYKNQVESNRLKKQQIERLNNIIDRIDSFVDRTIEVIKQQPTGNDEWILERLNGIKYLTELKEGK